MYLRVVRFKNLCISHVGILSWGNLIYTNSYIDFSVPKLGSGSFPMLFPRNVRSRHNKVARRRIYCFSGFILFSFISNFGISMKTKKKLKNAKNGENFLNSELNLCELLNAGMLINCVWWWWWPYYLIIFVWISASTRPQFLDYASDVSLAEQITM